MLSSSLDPKSGNSKSQAPRKISTSVMRSMQQPQPQPTAPPASTAGVGGIGSAFLLPSSSSHGQQPAGPQPPPPINSYFQEAPPMNGKKNGGINVDNIFASMAEGDGGGGGGAARSGNVNISNNIFHNFTTMNGDPAVASSGGGPVRVVPAAAAAAPMTSSAIPFRKYSDSTNYYSRSRMTGSNYVSNTTPAAPAPSSPTTTGTVASNNQFVTRSGNDGLSKSVGTASFLRRGSRTMSRSENDPATTIRHAGYLLKRSNLPYIASSTAMAGATISGIAPLPDLSRVDDDINNGVFSLPFGGLEEGVLVGGDDVVSASNALVGTGLPSDTMTLNALVSSPSAKGDVFQPAIEPTFTAMTSVATEDTVDEYIDAMASADEQPCFCSPIVQYFEKLFHRQRPSNALVTDKMNGINRKNHPSAIYGSPRKNKIPVSPKPTRRSLPLPITPTQLSPAVNSYSMPLKAPARSDLVPISPGGGRIATIDSTDTASILRRGSGSQLSRSFSNGSKQLLSTTTSMTKLAATPSIKEYPPPPPDYVDPKDGHIWRAKYCILEEGVLYFYRTAEEGDSDKAREERRESREQEQQLTEDIVLGEVYVNSSSLGRGGELPQQQGVLGGGDYQTSRKEMYDLSKSPMPAKRSEFFDFTKSPFHRSGSSVLTGTFSDAGGDGRSAMLRHSSSIGTFQQEADILWEKRVTLDCVGAVRSSQQEHGPHAFELLAYGSDDGGRGVDDQSDTSTRVSGGSGAGSGGQKHEIIDRLVLRAGGSDDMNAWMFQFHRSLMSFMQQIVDSVRSGGDHADILGIIRPDSPSHHRRLPTPIHHGAGVGNKGGPGALSSFASSPTTMMGGGNNSLSGGGDYVGSLSHGHGRNALYRRQVRDNKSLNNSGSVASVISPLPTPSSTPMGGSSPVEYPASVGALKKKMSPPSVMMIQSDSLKSKNKVDLPSLRDLRGEGKEKECVKAAAATAPKKYVPPHMRTAGPKKYVPPHMRRKLAETGGGDGGNGAAAAAATDKQVPLNDSPKKLQQKQSSSDVGDASDALDDNLSDSAMSATSTSSLLSRQLTEDSAGMNSTATNVRLGGCADPTVVVGSILDKHYMDRKASVVGNARTEAYGGRGGGSFGSFDGLDDADIATGGGGSIIDTPQNGRRRSVLKWEVGASSECGVRNSNEDSYVAIDDLDELIRSQGLASFSQQDLGRTRQQGFYAIFDGHVGNQAARFSAEKFHEILIEEQSSLASRDSASLSSIEERVDIILRKAFARLDRDFCNLCTADNRNWDSGSTALVALIVDDVVSLANLGDCRGVVCRLVSGHNGNNTTEEDGWEVLEPPAPHGGDLVWDRASGGSGVHNASYRKILWKEVTETHSPLLEEELARIEEANGWIIKETEIPIGQLHRMDIFDEDVVEIVKRCFADRMKQHRSDPVRQIQIARTCGDLAVSRAIGDRDFKAAYNSPSSAASGTAKPTTEETKEDLARSWEGPIVFLYPEGHSRRFKGDIVSNVPDIQTFRVSQEGIADEFLLMACDGLWDVMDGDDAVRIAKNLLFDKELSAKDGAARLAELAQHLGSSDNITVVLIRFYWEEDRG